MFKRMIVDSAIDPERKEGRDALIPFCSSCRSSVEQFLKCQPSLRKAAGMLMTINRKVARNACMLKSEPKNLVLVAGYGIRMSWSLSVPFYNFSME